MGSKVEEAREHLKAADKALKTSLLKWKPDFDTAADKFSQAAQCYRIAQDLKNSKDCYLKASEYYEKCGAFFHSAKSLETVIIVTKEVNTPVELYNIAEKSCRLYQQHGSGDSGANILDKTAKIIEEKAAHLALELYQKAADVSMTESGEHQASEYISKASRLAVRLGLYDRAADNLRQEIRLQAEQGSMGSVGRLTVAMVLVQLARGDAIAAEKAYKEWGGNCEPPEMDTIEQLLAAFDEEDDKAARRALSSPFIKHMDVEYARLAMCLPMPQAIDVPARPATTDAAGSSVADSQEDSLPGSDNVSFSPSSVRPATDEDEDELC